MTELEYVQKKLTKIDYIFFYSWCVPLMFFLLLGVNIAIFDNPFSIASRGLLAGFIVSMGIMIPLRIIVSNKIKRLRDEYNKKPKL